ncbi:hypothetical protein GCM10009678_22570 [Actinomadura kijaniata]
MTSSARVADSARRAATTSAGTTTVPAVPAAATVSRAIATSLHERAPTPFRRNARETVTQAIGKCIIDHVLSRGGLAVARSGANGDPFSSLSDNPSLTCSSPSDKNGI